MQSQTYHDLYWFIIVMNSAHFECCAPHCELLTDIWLCHVDQERLGRIVGMCQGFPDAHCISLYISV